MTIQLGNIFLSSIIHSKPGDCKILRWTDFNTNGKALFLMSYQSTFKKLWPKVWGEICMHLLRPKGELLVGARGLVEFA